MTDRPTFPLPTGNSVAQDVLGYLNFSSGKTDPAFLANVDALFRQLAAVEQPDTPENSRGIIDQLFRQLLGDLDQLSESSSAFSDVSQARAVIGLLSDHLLPKYQEFHADLLWHQTPQDLWQPLFIGRAFEALLLQGSPWDEIDRITTGALDTLNDYVGYRPLPVLESEQPMEAYPHERVRPIPLFIQGATVAVGPYEELITKALEILKEIDPDLLRAAWFDLSHLEELAIDPRAYDFDHPVNKRPSYHFGQWDPRSIDNRGYYRRFVVQQLALDSLMARVNGVAADQLHRGDGKARTRDELLLEAASVMAGTILMASGTSGDGPNCHSSDLTLGNLLPHIANYRDQFYEHLLANAEGAHGDSLREEAEQLRQPFGGARQHLNREIAFRRSVQLQHVHLARLYARMGYPESALEQSQTVQVASARIMCEIYCRLTAGHQAIDNRKLSEVAPLLSEIEGLLHSGIECGALADPWSILGFGGQFSLFPSPENSVRDFRVDDLVDLMEQFLDLCARAWTEAAAIDDAALEDIFSSILARLSEWWDQFATATIADVKRLVAKEVEVSANLVAGALNAWHKAGAAAGDIGFWRMFVDQFDSSKSFQLVIEALLDKGDHVASMALMMQWVSQVDMTPLEDGDASFHSLALRWMRDVEAVQLEEGVDQWPLVAKFLTHLEASAEYYWHVPAFELGDDYEKFIFDNSEEVSDSERPELDLPEFDDEDEVGEDDFDNLFAAAYEDVVYRDSTDDGVEADMLGSGEDDSYYELEEEADRLRDRLEFLNTVARLWKHAAIAWGAHTNPQADQRADFEPWQQQAATNYAALVKLIEGVHSHRIPVPGNTHQLMMEYDRRRMIKDSLVELIIGTCVEMSDAGRLLLASSVALSASSESNPRSAIARTIELLRALLAENPAAVRQHWKPFTESLLKQELLYVPLSKGGSPGRIVKSRALSQLINDLLRWLPRLGMVRETCELMEVAQKMEIVNAVGQGAVTEFDRLFEKGYRALVRCLVASADRWRENDPSGRAQGNSDSLLVESLQELTEQQLNYWLQHSKSLRLSVVEKLSKEDRWQELVDFIKRYGRDLFTQMFLNMGNLRAILHQQVGVWLSNLEQSTDAEEILLLDEIGTSIDREEAVTLLTLVIQTVVENYRAYRDYNTTTTQSDRGDMLYMFVDMIRVRSSYDRVAWNLKPVMIAHDVLVRNQRAAAAERWRQALEERTADVADTFRKQVDQLSEEYGLNIATVKDRISQRFLRPLLIDRIRALIRPAMQAVIDQKESHAFEALEREINSLASQPTGAGLDPPDWLLALEEEVSEVRSDRNSYDTGSDMLRRIAQVQLSWPEVHEQLQSEEE